VIPRLKFQLRARALCTASWIIRKIVGSGTNDGRLENAQVNANEGISRATVQIVSIG